jgi:hypothetical protein
MQPYAPRARGFLGVRHHGDWRLKIHSIVHGAAPLDQDAFAPGVAMALAALPEPAVTSARPGVGFVILHQGATGHYTVLGWWDRENELPLRIFVNPQLATDGWRRNEPSESICVWDLEVLAGERDAYVRALLKPGGGGVEAYLEDVGPTPSRA